MKSQNTKTNQRTQKQKQEINIYAAAHVNSMNMKYELVHYSNARTYMHAY